MTKKETERRRKYRKRYRQFKATQRRELAELETELAAWRDQMRFLFELRDGTGIDLPEPYRSSFTPAWPPRAY